MQTNQKIEKKITSKKKNTHWTERSSIELSQVKGYSVQFIVEYKKTNIQLCHSHNRMGFNYRLMSFTAVILF